MTTQELPAQERERFEAWLKQDREAKGYDADLWSAWQARARLAAQVEPTINYAILQAWAETWGLDYNGLCRTVRAAVAAPQSRPGEASTPAQGDAEGADAHLPLSEDQIEAMAREDAGGSEIDWTNEANLFATAPQRAAFRRGVKAALALGVSH